MKWQQMVCQKDLQEKNILILYNYLEWNLAQVGVIEIDNYSRILSFL